MRDCFFRMRKCCIHIIPLIRLALVFNVCASAVAAGELVSTNGVSFPVGEKLTYKLYWGFIPVGMASFSTGWTDQDGKKMYSVKMTARTTSVVALLYPVDDHIEAHRGV